MALSASVGFFYFVVCNRKPQGSSSAAVAAARGTARPTDGGENQQGKHRHHNHHHHHGGSRGMNGVMQQRPGGTASPAEGRHARLAQPERTRSRDSVRTGSQQSLRSAVAGAIGDTQGGGTSRSAAHAGRPPGSRYHHKRSHHKSRGFRPGVSRYKSGLEPHAEEDVEAAKSVVDLKRALASGSSSTAVMSHATNPKQFQSHQAWSEDGVEEAEFEQTSYTSPPKIVLSTAMDTQLHPMNTNDSLSEFNNNSNTMETQLMGESGSITMLGDTFNSTAELMSQDGSFSEEHQQRQIPTNISESEEPLPINEAKGYVPFTSKQNYDSNMKNLDSPSLSSVQPIPDSITHPISLPYTQSLQQSVSMAAMKSVSSMSSSSAISISSHSSSANLRTDGPVLSCTEPHNATSAVIDLNNTHRQQNPTDKDEGERGMSLELEPRKSHRSPKRHHRREKKDTEEEYNRSPGYSGIDLQSPQIHEHPTTHQNLVSETALPSSFSQDRQVVHDNHGSKMLGSVSHRDNHAFSYAGGDPDPDETADLKKIQEYMEELIEESDDV